MVLQKGTVCETSGASVLSIRSGWLTPRLCYIPYALAVKGDTLIWQINSRRLNHVHLSNMSTRFKAVGDPTFEEFILRVTASNSAFGLKLHFDTKRC